MIVVGPTTVYHPRQPESMPPRTHVLDYANTELVLGLVSPVGTDLSAINDSLLNYFRTFRYTVKVIKLSAFLDRLSPRTLGVKLRARPEYDRIRTRMDAGNALREKTGRGDHLALHAANEIAKGRSLDKNQPTPLPRTVHLLDSLKNPEEVAILRKIYGPGFYLIAVYSPEIERLEYLKTDKSLSQEQAEDLIDRDRSESSKLGQQTRDTFHLADAFIQTGDLGRKQLRRFVDLVFNHPYHTPTADEHAMFLAYAASLRSADLSRQVGAVVVSEAGEVIATGANDVPRFGGGLYYPEPKDEDARDFTRGFDSNRQQIRDIAEDTLKRVFGKAYTAKKAETLLEALKLGRLFDLTEFGRAVHAEMEALTACARVGVSPRRGTVYTTTFPCHNCAKHIIDAGIDRVVYIEPYPKSQALTLHHDAIRLEERDGGRRSTTKEDSKKVRFTPFIGIGPRRYFELFSMRLSGGEEKRRAVNGQIINWVRNRAHPRIGMSPASYLLRERLAASELTTIPQPSTSQASGSGRRRNG
jgi:deoxycytidylate deaminase